MSVLPFFNCVVKQPSSASAEGFGLEADTRRKEWSIGLNPPPACLLHLYIRNDCVHVQCFPPPPPPLHTQVDPHWSAVLAIAEEEAQLNQDYELAVSLSGGQQPAHPRHSHPNSSGPSGSLQRDFLQQASIAQRYREEYSRVEARATVPRAQARRAQAARTTPTAPAAPPTPVSPTTPAAPTPTSFHSHFSQFFAPHLATPTSPSPFQIFYNSPPPRSHPAQRNSASDAITISDTSSSSSESPIPSFTSMPDPHKSKGLRWVLTTWQ